MGIIIKKINNGYLMTTNHGDFHYPTLKDLLEAINNFFGMDGTIVNHPEGR